MIEEQKRDHGWEFLFIGANIDAIETAGRFGIMADRAVNYSADAAGVSAKYRSIDSAVSSLRRSEPIREDWKSEIEDDQNEQNRGSKPQRSGWRGLFGR
jgi:hypothetical protein